MDKEEFVIDNLAAPGTQWYAVKDPYEKDLATAPTLKRSTVTTRERNEIRRKTRLEQKESPYLQVSLQHNKTYQKKLNDEKVFFYPTHSPSCVRIGIPCPYRLLHAFCIGENRTKGQNLCACRYAKRDGCTET